MPSGGPNKWTHFCVAGIRQKRQACVDDEVVKGPDHRVPISFCSLLIVLCEIQKEIQHLLLGYAGKFTITELCRKPGEDEFTCLDRIFVRVGAMVLQMEIDCL